jgi:sigma-E factor negative regulatory protein RseC
MMQTNAVVIRLDGKNALVESIQSGGCGNCDSENGCSSSKLSQIFRSKPRRFSVRNECNAQPGSLVQISLQEGVLLHSAILMYILPLVIMLSGALLGAQWPDNMSDSDVYSAIGGLAGLISGFLLVRFMTLRGKFNMSAQSILLKSI